jgi:hypothetical protein
LGQLFRGVLAWEWTYRLSDKYIYLKDDSGKYGMYTMNDSTALIGVVKSGQLGLKRRSIPRMEVLLFYKKENNP